jgi:hypothetical protein
LLLEALVVLVVVSVRFDANKMRVNSVEYLTGSYPCTPREQKKGRMLVMKLM